MEMTELRNEIEKNLNGDRIHDYAYLLKTYDQLAIRSALTDEISEYLSKKNEECLLKGKHTDYPNEFGGDNCLYLKEIAEAISNKNQGKDDLAMDGFKDLLKKTESLYPLEDETSVYQSFGNPFEYDLYMENLKPSKKVVSISVPYSQLYYYLGQLLEEKGKEEEAKEAYQNSLRWNKVSCYPMIALSRIMRKQDKDASLQYLKEAYPFAYEKKVLGTIFTELGFLKAEEKEYQDAECLMLLGALYGGMSDIQTNLSYLEQQGFKPISLEFEQIVENLEYHHLPHFPDYSLMALLSIRAQEAEKNGETEMADLYRRLFHDLLIME